MTANTQKSPRPAPAEPDVSPAEAQEVEANAVTSDGYITVPMTGYDGVTKDVRVLIATKWRASAMRAINNGDFDGFMSLVLFEDDYEIYVDLDPDAGQVQSFAEEVGEKTGEALGKSGGSSKSQRSSRRS